MSDQDRDQMGQPQVAAAQVPDLARVELDDLLTFFARPDLTVSQAEELLSHVQGERHAVAERVLSWLEDVNASDAQASADGEPAKGASGTRQDVALVLLTYLSDATIVPRLAALVGDTHASDEFKLKLISVIHDLEPQFDSQALFDHLRYPGKAMLQSHRKHLQRLGSPLERSFWLDLMVDGMSADARISFAASSASVDDPAAVPVLICMCYDPDEQVALAAMDAVERYKDARALPALRELARYHPDERVREEAQKTADRLDVRVSLCPQVEPASPAPLLASYLTTVDGLGEQAAVFVRQLAHPSLEALLPAGLPAEDRPVEDSPFLRMVQVAFNDRTGIEQCFGLDVHRDDLHEVLGELYTQGLAPVPVPYDQAMALLERACEWTWQAGRLLPLSFVAWREWIRGDWTTAELQVPDAHPDTSEIPTPLRDRLLATCYELLQQNEFVSWCLEPSELDGLDERYLRLAHESGEPLAADALRALLRVGVEQIATPALCNQLQQRLYRTAPLLRELYPEGHTWQWAVVAADALSSNSPPALFDHPFLLGLVGAGLQSALDREIDWTAALKEEE